MKRVIVIGCPGAGKSYFARKLAGKLHLPLHYLDMIWHRPDKTNVSREEFDQSLHKIMDGEEWIIDGNYLRTLPLRLGRCDTVFMFDLPVEDCLSGARQRIGKPREDMPWMETEMDPEFQQWIQDFPDTQLPIINELLASCREGVDVRIFRSRDEADTFIASF